MGLNLLWNWGLMVFLHNKKVLNAERKEKEFSTSVFNIYNRGQGDRYSPKAFYTQGGKYTEIIGE